MKFFGWLICLLFLFPPEGYSQSVDQNLDRQRLEQRIEQLEHDARIQRMQKQTDDLERYSKELENENSKAMDYFLTPLPDSSGVYQSDSFNYSDLVPLNGEVGSKIIDWTSDKFLISMLFLFCVAIFLLFKRIKYSEKPFDLNERFGIKLIVVSIIVSIYLIAISDGWNGGASFVENVFYHLKIIIVPAGSIEALIDVDTVELLFFSALFGIYGLTTYFHWTPVIGSAKAEITRK